MENYLRFRIGKYEFFIPIRFVSRVYPAASMNDYPIGDYPSLAGFVIIEGEPIAVVSIHERLGVRFDGIALEHKMILMTWNSFRFLLIVDEVMDVPELDPAAFKDLAVNTYTKGRLLIDEAGRYILDDPGSFIREDILIDLTTGETILRESTNE